MTFQPNTIPVLKMNISDAILTLTSTLPKAVLKRACWFFGCCFYFYSETYLVHIYCLSGFPVCLSYFRCVKRRAVMKMYSL